MFAPIGARDIMLGQQVINGVMLGSVYAMVAVALTLSIGVLNFLNFSVPGLFMIGGGVPKNFAQDIVVAAEILGDEAPMHKYAVQVTVADVRDGALSSSTLKEASSWGKVDTTYEQMVYSEATLAVPLIAGYAYHKANFKAREAKRFNKVIEQGVTV